MIRLAQLEQEYIADLLSCLISQPTTEDSYSYIAALDKILTPEELLDVNFVVFSAIRVLAQTNSYEKFTPTINKDIIKEIIDQNLFTEVKNNYYAGFDMFMRKASGEPLNFDEPSIIEKFKTYLMQEVDELLDEAKELNLTIEESYARFPNFIQHYKKVLMTEAIDIQVKLINEETYEIRKTNPGWAKFFKDHRIYSGQQIDKFLMLISEQSVAKEKQQDGTISKTDTKEKYEQMQQRFIDGGLPLAVWDLEYLQQHMPALANRMTLMVGERGIGKTTVAITLAGQAAAQGLNVGYFGPEITDKDLLFSFFMPSYIWSKYGFRVTPRQVVGLDPVYNEGTHLDVKKREDIIKLAALEFIEGANFIHITENYHHDEVEQKLEAFIVEHKIDFLIWDHIEEMDGGDPSRVVGKIASVFTKLKKRHPLQVLAISHPGTGWEVPTEKKPKITGRISAWNKKIESASDMILGIFKSDYEDRLNIFFTKTRWGDQPLMYRTFRVDYLHNIMEYVEEDQYYNVNTPSLDTDEVHQLLETSGLYDTIDDEAEMLDFD